MASPVSVTVPVNTWTLVATNVTEGNVWILNNRAVYSHYYVATGGAAPTDMSEAAVLPEPGLPISVDVASDIYVYAAGVAGEVLVAL